MTIRLTSMKKALWLVLTDSGEPALRPKPLSLSEGTQAHVERFEIMSSDWILILLLFLALFLEPRRLEMLPLQRNKTIWKITNLDLDNIEAASWEIY